MEKFHAYIKRRGISQNDLAGEIGVSKGYLSQIIKGKRSPSREIIQKIATATEGFIPPDVWFDVPASSDAAD